MKRLLIVLLAGLIFSLLSQNAFAFIGVGNFGETGWQTFSYTFRRARTVRGAFVVSNFGDTLLDSVLLLDNLSHGVAGNLGFESGLSGYGTDGDVVVVSSFVSAQGNTYFPTEGSQMGRLLASGADTSAFGGTDGAFLWTPLLSFNEGDVFTANWAFLAFDYLPFQDFAFVFAEENGQVACLLELSRIVPEPASLSLLGLGLLGLMGIKRRS